MKEEKTTVSGYYFYDHDKFIEDEAYAKRFARDNYNNSNLDALLREEHCVFSTWGLDELCMLLNRSLNYLVENKIISGIELPKQIDLDDQEQPKNVFKTVTTNELVNHTKSAINNFKQRLIEQIGNELVEPRKLKLSLEIQKKVARNEVESRSILNQLNAVNSEIAAYHNVLNMLK